MYIAIAHLTSEAYTRYGCYMVFQKSLNCQSLLMLGEKVVGINLLQGNICLAYEIVYLVMIQI